MGNSAKRDAQTVATDERRQRSYLLRITGKTYQQVADEIGHGDKSNASKDVKHYIAQIHSELAETAVEHVAIELSRIEAMLAGLWEPATSGNTDAVKAATGLMKRKAEMLGLDAPKVQKVEGVFSLDDLLTKAITAAKENEADGSSDEPEPG